MIPEALCQKSCATSGGGGGVGEGTVGTVKEKCRQFQGGLQAYYGESMAMMDKAKNKAYSKVKEITEGQSQLRKASMKQRPAEDRIKMLIAVIG